MDKKEQIKNSVLIPKYFEEIVVPQLGSYYANYPVDFDAKPVVCCPLHDEDTPSMRYYEETNTFYCFGCRNGGDIITLHRKFIERQTGSLPTFSEAVEFLFNYFIKGKEATKVVRKVKHLIEEEPLNSNVDLLRFQRFAGKLNNQTLIDSGLSIEDKQKIWRKIDVCELLLAKNKIRASDAIQFIKSDEERRN